MSISSALTALNQDIQNARTAIVNKGGTVTTGGGSSQLATDIATISGGSSDKYSLLDIIKDDSNTEIGTVSGFFTDSNDVEYAVVCLDAAYRYASGVYCSSATTITNMPIYNNLVTANAWESKITATENTQLILDYCSSNGYTSTACNHCRAQSFIIGGIRYYGQLPNIKELSDIVSHYNAIEQLDVTSSIYSDTNFSSPRNLLQSNQHTETQIYCYTAGSCAITGTVNKTTKRFVCPVLEIPNGE